MKNISILGSTGSIGTQTLEIVDNNSEELNVVGLACYSNVDIFEKQVRKYQPKAVCVYSEKAYLELKERISDLDIEVYSGMEGLINIAVIAEADIVVTAIVGMIGIRPTVEAIKAGKDIALANKETLVTAGHIIMPLCTEHNVSILPVDSEHSAIFQSLNGQDRKNIKKILLTCSGGPFRGYTYEQLQKCTMEDALKHPNWSMGRKITIDSASLVNKGLEVMEAKWLFDVEAEDIEVLVHPQSIVHSAVEYVDGAVIAQLGLPDMKLPIQYALFYPERKYMPGDKLDLFKTGSLTFEKPDMDTFLGLKLAYAAIKEGGSMPCVFNAANEKAVALFLNKKIGFTDIYKVIDESMNRHNTVTEPTLDEVLSIEQETYRYIDEHIGVN